MGYKVAVHNQDGSITIIDTRDVAEAQADALKRLGRQFSTDPAYEGERIAAGCTYGGNRFQIDQASRVNINGASTMALIAAQNAQAFSIGWRATDNSTVTFDGPAMIGFGVAVGSYYSALFAHYQALKDQIVALTTNSDCDAFDVTAGWPG